LRHSPKPGIDDIGKSPLIMTNVPHGDDLVRAKAAEHAWHDKFYAANARCVYPDSLEEFRSFFARHHLTPFCDGGGSWWADARREMVDALGDVRGKRVLDYACGFGMLGMYLSSSGAEVCGFDLSSAAVEVAKEAALKYGLSAKFEQMDATEPTYPDEYFDLAVGFGVIHHVVKYPGVAGQLLRVLKAGGKAAFHETLWDNPAFNLARRFTVESADSGDAPLGEREIQSFFRDFATVSIQKYHLLYMAKRLARPLLTDWNAKCQPRPFWRAMKRIDKQLLRFSPLRRYCGEVVVFLER
jgi:2-polyprenyl-3-methyl-5-hydroxy-6-metoxy-1,4-benzoquinol methylase